MVVKVELRQRVKYTSEVTFGNLTGYGAQRSPYKVLDCRLLLGHSITSESIGVHLTARMEVCNPAAEVVGHEPR